ncbi:MAG: hypothetical protein ACREM6_11265 [Vulcanimicrobiaceae bacterium]
MIDRMKIFTAALLAATLMPVAALAATNLPAGTQINGVVQQSLDTKSAYNGQKFTIVTQNGSTINGHLSQVVKSSISHKAHMTLNIDSIQFSNGTSAPLAAKVTNVAEKKSINIARAAGSLIVGNIAGNMLGHAIGVKGVGGLVGLAGGALYAANTARDIQVPKDAKITIQLTEALNVRPQAGRP